MSKSPKRVRQVADLVKREVALLMKTAINDPRLTDVMITSVDVSPDLSNARVYFSLMNASAASDAEVALEKAKGFIRHMLSKKTDLRYTPALSFVHDETAVYASELIDLIDRVQPTTPSDE